MKNSILLTLVIFVLSAPILHGCAADTAPIPISEKSNAELAQLLETFEHANNDESAYTFYEIVAELERRGVTASETAPTLARAITFNRRDSVTASNALIAMKDSALPAIPYLLQNLDSDREEVRRYSIFVLGVIGESSSCAVPKIASLLWDTEPYVRSTSAAALTEIVSRDLVQFEDFLDPSVPGSVNADEPEGRISGIAREWWLETGQNLDWPKENCSFSE